VVGPSRIEYSGAARTYSLKRSAVRERALPIAFLPEVSSERSSVWFPKTFVDLEIEASAKPAAALAKSSAEKYLD
jgi:hypothetical protein